MTRGWSFWCKFWFLDCQFRMILCVLYHCWFLCNIAIEIPLSVSFWIPIDAPHEVWGFSVFHLLLTMTIDRSPRPILVMSAECMRCLLIYILLNLTPVDIWHPTSPNLEILKWMINSKVTTYITVHDLHSIICFVQIVVNYLVETDARNEDHKPANRQSALTADLKLELDHPI